MLDTVKQLHKIYGIADIAPGGKRESRCINNVPISNIEIVITNTKRKRRRRKISSPEHRRVGKFVVAFDSPEIVSVYNKTIVLFKMII